MLALWSSGALLVVNGMYLVSVQWLFVGLFLVFFVRLDFFFVFVFNNNNNLHNVIRINERI